MNDLRPTIPGDAATRTASRSSTTRATSGPVAAWRRGPVAAACAAALCALAPAAHAGLVGTLYPGLGYDIVTEPGGDVEPVGFVSPTLAYVLPNASSGGSEAGRGLGVGAAQYSTGTGFIGYRGLVTSPTGSYQLDTLGTNSVAGWTPVGFGSSTAQGVTDAGMIVGTSEYWANGGTQDLGGRPVWWGPGETVPRQLPMPADFTDTTGAGFGGASSVSAGGAIVGWGTRYRGDIGEGNRVLRWMSPNAAPDVLQRLPGVSQFGGNNSSGVAINDAGTVVGSGAVFDAAGNLKGLSAIRWDAGTTAATPLGHLGTYVDGTYSSHAIGVNARGTTVGQSAKYDNAHQPQGDAAVRWAAKSSKPVELEGLGVGRDGQSWTYALGISDADVIIGVGQQFTAAGDPQGWRAMRWLPGETKPHALKPLSMGLSGATYTYAFAINHKGWIVGNANAVLSSSNDFSNPMHVDVHAVVWGPDGTIHDLNSLLPAGSPWQLYSAYAISDSGLVTGIGYYKPDGYTVDYSYPRLYSMQLTKTAD